MFLVNLPFQTLKQQVTDIGGFAMYAKNQARYKKATPHFQQSVDYIKSLFEVNTLLDSLYIYEN